MKWKLEAKLIGTPSIIGEYKERFMIAPNGVKSLKWLSYKKS